MRPSALKMEQRCEDIRKGLLILIPVVLALFLFRTAGINNARGTAGSGGNAFVQVEGDVKFPGVYSFYDQTDIRGLIEQGGGISPEAHTDIGFADIPILSGSKITVQSDNSSCKFIHGEISSFHKITLGMPVSINIESEEGLTAVPGIGPLLAQSIVKARTEQGGFRSLEDLKSVRGIGDKTYKKIIAYIIL
jgi:competence protein ComEA